MAKAISARRQGDEYQARWFWIHLLGLRINDYVESVCLESDRISFVDDIVVKYREPINDSITGKQISLDFYQCKYHVTQNGAFTYKNLLNPSFINCKESMLKRLYKAYKKLSNSSKRFRLYIVSNWFWHPDDELSCHLSEERIRGTFYKGGPRSKTGIIRSEFCNHLLITEKELYGFLDTVRFQLGKNLTDLAKELEPRLKLANLISIDVTTTNMIYDDLTWKLFSQGRNHFTPVSFNKMLHEEKLIIRPLQKYSEISICSCPQEAHRPHDLQAVCLNLSDLFDGRFPRSKTYWKKGIPERIISFFQSSIVKNLPQPIHLFFDCHLSIAFLIGNLLDPKFGVQIVPAQKTRTLGYEFWPESRWNKSGLWNIRRIKGKIDTEVVIGISVTNPIENHLLPFLNSTKLKELPRILFRPANGVGPRAIINGEHAWQLAYEIQTLLRERLSVKCHTIHLFFAGPVALAYIFGNTLRYITKTIQLYEHDFEGINKLRYYLSIRLPIKKSI
jgi:hypothetical protein